MTCHRTGKRLYANDNPVKIASGADKGTLFYSPGSFTCELQFPENRWS